MVDNLKKKWELDGIVLQRGDVINIERSYPNDILKNVPDSTVFNGVDSLEVFRNGNISQTIGLEDLYITKMSYVAHGMLNEDSLRYAAPEIVHAGEIELTQEELTGLITGLKKVLLQMTPDDSVKLKLDFAANKIKAHKFTRKDTDFTIEL